MKILITPGAKTYPGLGSGKDIQILFVNIEQMNPKSRRIQKTKIIQILNRTL